MKNPLVSAWLRGLIFLPPDSTVEFQGHESARRIKARPSGTAIAGLAGFITLLFGQTYLYRAVTTGTYDVADLFGADELYIPMLVRDILRNGASWWDWNPPHTPYIFPDVLMYLPMDLIFGDIQPSMVFVALLQLLLIAMCSHLIIRVLYHDAVHPVVMSWPYVVTSLLTISLANGWMTVLRGNNDYPYLYHLVILGLHTGAFISSLLAIGLLMTSLKYPHRSWPLPLLAVVCFASTYSDALFYLQFSLSWLCCLPFIWWRLPEWRRRLIFPTAIILASSELGRLAYPHLTPTTTPMSNVGLAKLADISESMSNLLLSLGNYLLPSWLWCTIPGMGVLALGALALMPRRSADPSRAHDAHVSISKILSWFLLVSFVATCFGVAMKGKYNGAANMRWLTAVYFTPVLLAPMLVGSCHRFAGRLLEVFSFVAIVVSSATMIFFWPKGEVAIPNLAGYQTEAAKCLDELAEEYGLHSGVADYWLAKPLTALSMKTDYVNAVYHSDSAPRIWIANSAWFTMVETHPLGGRYYDFAVASGKLTRELIVGRFGPPAAESRCTKSEVLIYNRPEDLAFREAFEFIPLSRQ